MQRLVEQDLPARVGLRFTLGVGVVHNLLEVVRTQASDIQAAGVIDTLPGYTQRRKRRASSRIKRRRYRVLGACKPGALHIDEMEQQIEDRLATVNGFGKLCLADLRSSLEELPIRPACMRVDALKHGCAM